jgi:type VI secretion system protein ImpK
MKEFERKIQEALAAARQNLQPVEHSTQWMQHAAGMALAAKAMAASSSAGGQPSTSTQLPETATLAQPVPQASVQTRESQSTQDKQQAATIHWVAPGELSGRWENPLIMAAMPLLLLVEHLKSQHAEHNDLARHQIVRHIQHFQTSLQQQALATPAIDHMAYLLCAYVDECYFGSHGAGSSNLSLLVEFYRDAWGGEKCFEHLQHYMQQPQAHLDILGLYHLILALGFVGQYHMLERGAVLLADLRQRLHSLLYSQPVTGLSQPQTVPVRRMVRWLTPWRVLAIGAILSLLAYGSATWYLHDQSRDIRHTILAWTPPEPRKVNIMETLPDPLPKILAEGWLEVREDPRGWLLIFTSDGAFATGKAILSTEFRRKRNIERLGDALAPWPGDLEVIGHTDSQPFRLDKNNNNMRLSLARAQTVAALISQAVQQSKYPRSIDAIGKGDTEPLENNNSEQGRRRNRRVDVLWKIGERGENAFSQNAVDEAPQISPSAR